MVVSHWPDMSAPALINPDDAEIAVFAAKERIDTVRLCVDGDTIAFGSGFGHTHTSVANAAKKAGYTRFFPENYILYRIGTEWYWNMVDLNGHESVPFKRGKRYMSDKAFSAMETLISLYEG